VKTPERFSLLLGLVFIIVPMTSLGAENREARIAELDDLVTPAEKTFLLDILADIAPPERLLELADYGQHQLDLGGGFYGMLPDQMADPALIPLPRDEIGIIDAAICLARQRRENLVALEQLNPDYVPRFEERSLVSFLDQISTEIPASTGEKTHLYLNLDFSALEGFFRAIDDGEISVEESLTLAALPSNQAMLQHRRNLGYVPEPLPDTESLATMICTAGSSDPVDRLWCWINPQNAFDYADLVQNADQFRDFITELDAYGDELADAALARIAIYTPPESHLETTFAMTVGWAIRGWVTPDMAGLNIEQIKNDWHFLFGTMVEETYHRLQLQLFPSPTGIPATAFSDIVTVDTGDVRYDRLYEILAYTAAEGAANLVRGPFADASLGDKAQDGANLMARFVRQVVVEGDLETADALLNEGLKGNGPLYGLGWKLAAVIVKRDGDEALGKYQQAGPVRFFLHGADLADEEGDPLITAEVYDAVEALADRLDKP